MASYSDLPLASSASKTPPELQDLQTDLKTFKTNNLALKTLKDIYHIELLGEGGYGNVYKFVFRSEPPKALKIGEFCDIGRHYETVADPESYPHGTCARQLETANRVLFRLKKECASLIVPVYGNYHYATQENAPGDSMCLWMDIVQPLKTYQKGDIVKIMYIAEALVKAHFVFPDLKTPNLGRIVSPTTTTTKIVFIDLDGITDPRPHEHTVQYYDLTYGSAYQIRRKDDLTPFTKLSRYIREEATFRAAILTSFHLLLEKVPFRASTPSTLRRTLGLFKACEEILADKQPAELEKNVIRFYQRQYKIEVDWLKGDKTDPFPHTQLKYYYFPEVERFCSSATENLPDDPDDLSNLNSNSPAQNEKLPEYPVRQYAALHFFSRF